MLAQNHCSWQISLSLGIVSEKKSKNPLFMACHLRGKQLEVPGELVWMVNEIGELSARQRRSPRPHELVSWVKKIVGLRPYCVV